MIHNHTCQHLRECSKASEFYSTKAQSPVSVCARVETGGFDEFS